MTKERNIRIWGKQREDIDADLMAQIVIMLGRQLAHEAATGNLADSNKPQPPKHIDLSGDELGQEDAS
jgi:hypothetical protein